LESTKTARDIFKVLSNFFEEHGIEWNRFGFQALIKTVAANAIGTCCFIHTQALAAKTLPSGLKKSCLLSFN
jgi:hypothetical protein